MSMKSGSNQLTSVFTRATILRVVEPKMDASGVEAGIDKVVYELYGLIEDEVKVVERKV